MIGVASMTVQQFVQEAERRLAAAGIGRRDARTDAAVLARAALGWDRARFLSDGRGEAPEAFGERYEQLVARRARREPVAYITGTREFWGLDFEVTPAVLIPRPETELIVQEALACCDHLPAVEAGSPHVVVDAGTGSGCLAIALACERPGLHVAATDISMAALGVARRNAQRHGVADRVALLEGNFLEPVPAAPHLVVSNPPYVPAADSTLPPEVRDHEPATALLAGADGLDAIRELVRQAAERLARGGWLVFEFGYGQESAIRRLVAGTGALTMARVAHDLQGIPRAAVAVRI